MIGSRKVVVVGAGISGLISAYNLKKHNNVDITVIEENKIGGDFLTNGLKYIRYTNEIVKFFDELDVAYSDYNVRGGVLLRGKVEKYPQMDGFKKDQIKRIQRDYFRKTRKTEPDNTIKKSMIDLAATKPSKAVRVDQYELIKSLYSKLLVSNVKFKKTSLKEIGNRNNLYLSDDSFLSYDYLILTIPIWEFDSCCDWGVPNGVAVKLNTVEVMPRKDKYVKWDYVYTPYTPNNSVSRITPHGEFYVAEIFGKLNMLDTIQDLNFIFSGGHTIGNIKRDMNGYMFNSDKKPKYPKNVTTIGRYAQWDKDMSIDLILNRVVETGKNWFM